MARRRGSPRIDASGGDWSDEDISGLDLSGASFHGANLRNVRALGTDLSRADLREARLDQLAIDLYTCLRDARLPDSASDTYVHVYVRDAQDAGTLAAYGLESIPDNFACLEFREFLRLQPHYGYRTD